MKKQGTLRKSLVVLGAVLLMVSGSAMAQFQADLITVGDASIAGWDPDSNDGGNPGMYVSNDWTGTSSLIQFDLSSFAGLSGADIQDATLTLQLGHWGSGGNLGIAVHRSVYDWEEMAVTYANYGDLGIYNQPNDWDNNADTFINGFNIWGGEGAGTTKVFNVDVTSAVQGWVNGDFDNFGFFLTKWAGTSGNANKYFGTKESVDGYVLPTLSVSYVPEPATIGLLMIGGLALLRRRSA